ncbi:hypothetical protein ACFU7X_03215 [Streptomyces chartreusis]
MTKDVRGDQSIEEDVNDIELDEIAGAGDPPNPSPPVKPKPNPNGSGR